MRLRVEGVGDVRPLYVFTFLLVSPTPAAANGNLFEAALPGRERAPFFVPA